MNKNPFTYKKSGVDIGAADKFVNFISRISSKKKGQKKVKQHRWFWIHFEYPKKY